MTGQIEKAPQFIVVRETKTEQAYAQADTTQGTTQGNPFADAARETLRLQLEKMMAEALAWHEVPEMVDKLVSGLPLEPPHYAIKITTGVGKSDQLRLAVAGQYIPEATRKGLPHRVLKLVSTHKLADEARAKMPNGITVAVWQGRKATKLNTTEPMCLNLPAVEAAEEIGAVVEETACRKAKRGQKTVYCPFYDACHYQRQKGPAASADVVYAAHEIMFRVPPALGEFGLVIVDEAFWPKGLSGTEQNTKSRLIISSLADELAGAPVRGHHDKPDITATMQLRDLIERLQGALVSMDDGYVTRAPLIKAGLLPETADESGSCKTASDLEWRRKVNSKLKPDSSDQFREKVVAKFGFMRRIPKRSYMWRALGELIESGDDASGRLKIEMVKTEDGEQRALRLLQRKPIPEKLYDLPIIHADATLQLELAQQYLPKLDLVLDLNVRAPHMRVVQVVGMPVGKSSLEPKPPGVRRGKQRGAWTETPEEAEARVAHKREALASACRQLMMNRHGLVITYRDIEADFAGIENVEVAHFGAVEGIDRWSGVEVAVIIGRPMPSREAVENLAAAVTREPVIAGTPIKQFRPIVHGYNLGCWTYEEPAAELIRQGITEAHVIQALGRVRGVNRTTENPVEVYLVLDDVILPGVPIDEVIRFTDIKADSIHEMVARGMLPQMPTDARKIHSDLFTSRSAAKMAYHRAGLRAERGPRGPRLVTNLNRYRSIKRCDQPPWVALLYQPAGRGQHSRFCMVDLVKIPNPRAALEAALGPLALFEVLGGKEDEPAAEAAE